MARNFAPVSSRAGRNSPSRLGRRSIELDIECTRIVGGDYRRAQPAKSPQQRQYSVLHGYSSRVQSSADANADFPVNTASLSIGSINDAKLITFLYKSLSLPLAFICGVKHIQLDQVSESPAIARDSLDMTALEIFAVTAGLLVNGYLAISELRVDYLQRSHMKRLVADGYARLRAARFRRRYVRRVLRKGKLAKPSGGAVRERPRVASKQKSRLHRKVLRHRAERKRRKEGKAPHNHNHAGQQGNEENAGCRQGASR